VALSVFSSEIDNTRPRTKEHHDIDLSRDIRCLFAAPMVAHYHFPARSTNRACFCCAGDEILVVRLIGQLLSSLVQPLNFLQIVDEISTVPGADNDDTHESRSRECRTAWTNWRYSGQIYRKCWVIGSDRSAHSKAWQAAVMSCW